MGSMWVYCFLFVNCMIRYSSCALDDLATDFFMIHDSSTTYKQNGISHSAYIHCDKDDCSLSVSFASTTLEYKFKKQQVRILDTCPPAICPPGKTNFTTNPVDYCPVCDLGESYRREPCSSSDHCPMKLGCSQSNNCHYSKKPDTIGRFSRFCQFQFDCPAFHVCSKGHGCRADDSVVFHVEGKGCQANEDCGEHFECDQAQHTCSVKNNYCQSEDMCRAGWTCKENQCVEDDEDDKGVQNSPDKCDCRECEALCNIKT